MPRLPNSTDLNRACLFFPKEKSYLTNKQAAFPSTGRVDLRRAGAGGGGLGATPSAGPELRAPGGCVRSPPGASGRGAGQLGRLRGRAAGSAALARRRGGGAAPLPGRRRRPEAGLSSPPSPSARPPAQIQLNASKAVERGAEAPGGARKTPTQARVGPRRGRSQRSPQKKHGKQQPGPEMATRGVSASAEGAGAARGAGPGRGREARGTRVPGLGPLQLAD